MSIATGAKLAELERQILELSRALTDALARIKALETTERPRLGRPPKER